MKHKLIGLLIATLGLTTALKAQDLNGNYQSQNQDNYPQQRDRNRDNYPQKRDKDNDRNRNEGYYDDYDDDLYARRQGNQYGNYPFDNRNPFDTRSQSYDPRNPFDPRPIYDQYRHGRWNDNDYRYNADPFDYCPNRQLWAFRFYPLDPRNPYDIRNIFGNRRNGYGYNDGRNGGSCDNGRDNGYGGRGYGNQQPRVVYVPVPKRKHHNKGRWGW